MPLNPMKSSPVNSKTAKSERTVNYREIATLKHRTLLRSLNTPKSVATLKHRTLHRSLNTPNHTLNYPRKISQIAKTRKESSSLQKASLKSALSTSTVISTKSDKSYSPR